MRKEIPDLLDSQGLVRTYSLSPAQIMQFADYAELLVRTNRVMNLTAITDPLDIVQRHFADSLTILEEIDAYCAACGHTAITLADVGTGAGFPGIPVKIVRPDLHLTLIDSLAKRIGFLNNVIEVLQLQNVRTFHMRAEDAGRAPELREQFDLTTARAVAAVSVLSEYCLPLNQVGGRFIVMKGDDAEDIASGQTAIRRLGGRSGTLRRFELPGTDMKRTVLTVEKIAPTPAAYPRRSGIPSKKPL